MIFGFILLINGLKNKRIDITTLIIGEIEFIADNHLIGKSAEQTRKNYRVTKIKSHLIYYRKAENKIVEVVRILHQRMDVKKRLK